MFRERCLWLLLAVFVLLVVLWFVRESRILEPVQLDKQLAWRDWDWQSGDLLLFSGAGLMGRAGEVFLKVTGRCPYTHIGLIYLDPRKPDDVYVWEMKNAPVGTRLSPLERVMTRYRGRLVVRPLLGPQGRGVDRAQLRTFIRSRWGLDYAYDFYFSCYNRFFPGLPMPAWSSGCHRPVRFCADLIAETLHAVGVLDYKHNPDSVQEAMPRDFAQATQKLPLAPGWCYGDEVLLTGTLRVP